MLPRLFGFIVLCAAAATCPGVSVGQATATGGTGAVHGKIRVDQVNLASLGPTVVYLDGTVRGFDYEPPSEVPTIHQHDARFEPSFLVVAVGQSVAFPNEDPIFHNVFSYATGNAFDLGLYRSGTSKTVTFLHPGAVQVYCSIHASMNAVVYVAASPYFTVADSAGSFEIRNVPTGRYQLRTWNRQLVERSVEVEIVPGQSREVSISFEQAR
jgi:plastocyanin